MDTSVGKVQRSCIIPWPRNQWEWTHRVHVNMHIYERMPIWNHCNTLQHTATHCNTLQHTATHSNTTRINPPLSSTLLPRRGRREEKNGETRIIWIENERKRRQERNVGRWRRGRIVLCVSAPTLQHTAAHCNTLQHTAAHCNTLQHTLQHTATHCITLRSYSHSCRCKISFIRLSRVTTQNNYVTQLHLLQQLAQPILLHLLLHLLLYHPGKEAFDRPRMEKSHTDRPRTAGM